MSVYKKIIQCDRCGATGEEHKEGPFRNGMLTAKKCTYWHVNLMDGNILRKETRIDLCVKCAEAFSLFMDGYEAKRR